MEPTTRPSAYLEQPTANLSIYFQIPVKISNWLRTSLRASPKLLLREILNSLWLRPIHKSKVSGIDGTLFYNHADKRHHLPASKREIDRDLSQINPAERELYARLRSESAATVASPLPITTAELLVDVPGGSQLLQWFGGRVPSFHDAEVLALALDREKTCCSIRVHTFEMTPEVDAKGFFVLRNHVVVSFRLHGVVNLELNDFNEQNAIFGLSLSRTADRGYRLELEPCHGLFGFIEAQTLTIELEPGKPRIRRLRRSCTIAASRPNPPSGILSCVP